MNDDSDVGGFCVQYLELFICLFWEINYTMYLSILRKGLGGGK